MTAKLIFLKHNVLPFQADNTPIVQTMTVQENANISTVVGRVTPAVDADTGENAVINYFIVGKCSDIIVS